MKGLMNKVFVFGSTLAVGAGILFAPEAAFASSTISEGLSNAGVDGAASLDVAGDLGGVVTFIIAIAAIWTIACIIFAAMKISGSQGNAQKRVEGIIGLVFAGGGAWVIYNAYNIYGWFSSIGA